MFWKRWFGKAEPPAPQAPAMPAAVAALPDDVRAEIDAAIDQGRMIEAIKAYRIATSTGLAEARAAVHAIAAERA